MVESASREVRLPEWQEHEKTESLRSATDGASGAWAPQVRSARSREGEFLV